MVKVYGRRHMAFYDRLMPWKVIEYIRVNSHDLSDKDTYFIYQPGKVGSTTVAKVLYKLDLWPKKYGIKYLDTPMFHVHTLTERGIASTELFHRERGQHTEHDLCVSKHLVKRLKSTGEMRWNIITLVRDPIAFEVSSLFEYRNFYPGLVKNGKINLDLAIKLLGERVDYMSRQGTSLSTWLDSEISTTTGVSLYDHEFDKDKGYSIVRTENARILAIRTEDIDTILPQALQEFIGVQVEHDIKRLNSTQEKPYGEDYRMVLDVFKVPPETCSRVYAGRYARHFYNKKQISQFKDRWST